MWVAVKYPKLRTEMFGNTYIHTYSIVIVKGVYNSSSTEKRRKQYVIIDELTKYRIEKY